MIKCLIVLAYTQMLIQQMENKRNLSEDYQAATNLLLGTAGHDDYEQHQQDTTCCSSWPWESKEAEPGLLGSSLSWFNCVWQSTRACSQRAGQPTGSRASRLFGVLVGAFRQFLALLINLVSHAYERLISAHLGLAHVYSLWLVRWRSPIIQRLMQSVFIQIFYICSILFGSDDDDQDYL